MSEVESRKPVFILELNQMTFRHLKKTHFLISTYKITNYYLNNVPYNFLI